MRAAITPSPCVQLFCNSHLIVSVPETVYFTGVTLLSENHLWVPFNDPHS